MKRQKIAVVLTCFNRKEKTDACLEALINAARRMGDKIDLHIIITDDGSKDGTPVMLHARYPQVEVLQGDGNLYWNGGMRLAYGRVIEQGYDFYLWLNDDTTLYPEFLEHILAVHESLQAETGKSGIVVGSTCDDNGKVTYGGLYRPNPKKPLKFDLIQPSAIPLPCESTNGNCLLISSEAAQQLGNLDVAYVHGMGDMDYGLRASRAGIPLWVMPGFVGECGNDHPLKDSYLDTSLPFAVRWKMALSPKELNPHAWAVFCHRHAGILWPLYWAWPYAKILFTSLMAKFTSTVKV